MIETLEFKDAESLLDLLSPWGKRVNLSGFVFRGHSQESYQLIPAALRQECSGYLWKICGLGKPISDQYNWQTWQVKAEYTILRSFYRLADQRGLEVPVSNRVRANLAQEFDVLGLSTVDQPDTWIPSDLYETAALAQHYGIPTRLLDWTYDLYISLYFAARGGLGKSGNLVIWALNKEHLSFLKPTVNCINVEFITPHYAGNPNLSAQKGLFTHWPISRPSMIAEMQAFATGSVELVDRRSLDDLILDRVGQIDDKTNIFKKFIIPCSEAAKLCKILDSLGYDSARVFPGYNGVANQLLNLHKYS